MTLMARFLRLFVRTGFLICLIATLGACAVNNKQMYMFTAVRGLVVKSGEPVAGLKVGRFTSWSADQTPGIETTYTDENGYYEFAGMKDPNEAGLLPNLFNVTTMSERIYCFNENKEIWLYVNSNGNDNSPVKHRDSLLQLISDLEHTSPISRKILSVDSKILGPGERL